MGRIAILKRTESDRRLHCLRRQKIAIYNKVQDRGEKQTSKAYGEVVLQVVLMWYLSPQFVRIIPLVIPFMLPTASAFLGPYLSWPSVFQRGRRCQSVWPVAVV